MRRAWLTLPQSLGEKDGKPFTGGLAASGPPGGTPGTQKVTLAHVPPAPFTPLRLHHLPQAPRRCKESKFFTSSSPAPSPPSRPQGHRFSRLRGAARVRGRAQGRAEQPLHSGRTPRGSGARGAAGPPPAGGCSAPPGPRAGRQVNGAAPPHPRCAAAPPLAAEGRGEPEERRRPPRPRTLGCFPTGEGRAASNKPLHNRRLPQGTWTGRAYVTTLLNTGLIWF